MKLSFSTVAAGALALAVSADAWRFNGFQLQDFKGPKTTKGGPGGTGSACFGVGDLNNKISSLEWYSDDAAHGTRCCIQPFNGLGCTNFMGQTWCNNIRVYDLGQIDMDNKITTYKTSCWKRSSKRGEEDQGEWDEFVRRVEADAEGL
ncbi:hypothetical protein FQN57_007004 [Myotisia sp. PD_48]|nr:hypothetical protein FQN57_007004 [Myotisia sp. PD_48]